MQDTVTLSSEDVLERLSSRRNGRSLRDFANELGISHSYLWDVLRGYRPPGPVILEYLKLTKEEFRTVRYHAVRRRR